ncbi:1-acyl-sn-glycerol-3-phosphate acyltransferase [candidate division KSB1 bacterium]|nr:1-acyl-sn-glycerol-3-phosphate acyltransferase [candidate division KSB1 bacterium]
MIFRISLYIIRFFTKIYFRGQVYQKENLPKQGPYVGVINHNSFMDIPAMSLVVRGKVHTMAKDSLFKVPVLGWWLKKVNMFPVIRDASDQTAFKHALSILERKEIVFMSPEGTRKRHSENELPRARTGFVRLAQMAGCNVVPIAISGTRNAMPPEAKFPRPVKIRAMIGKPVMLEKVAVDKANKHLLQDQADMIMATVYEMQRQLEEMDETGSK